MQRTGNEQAASTAGRLVYVDWLRGWALLAMIETHVFNALLDLKLRSSGWFRSLNYVNGLVAPSFLFVSGLVFVIASEKRSEALRSFGRPFWQQIRRIVTVWAIGYAMHLPPYWLSHPFRTPPPEEWSQFLQADVLHCIGATWLFLLGGFVLIPRPALRDAWFAGWAVALTALAPAVWNAPRGWLPPAVEAYFSPKNGSLFPLLPWSAFMLCGALCGSWTLRARSKGREQRLVAAFAACGAAMFLAGQSLPPSALTPSGAAWHADPRSFLERLGLVLVLLACCWLYGRLRRPRHGLLLDISRASLFVYVAHLLVLYGPLPGGASLAERIGPARSPVECAAASALLGAVMGAGAPLWRRLFEKHGARA